MCRQKKLVKIAFWLLIALFLGGPIFADIDPWDAFPDTGDTMLLALWTTALCLGAIILFALRIFGLLQGRTNRIPFDFFHPIDFEPVSISVDAARLSFSIPFRI